MNLTKDEALAFLNKLKGSFVFAKVRVNSARDEQSIGVVRFDSNAMLESCDGEGLSLTWSGGRMYVCVEGASFRFPDPEETAPVAIEIILPEGARCVICLPGEQRHVTGVLRLNT